MEQNPMKNSLDLDVTAVEQFDHLFREKVNVDEFDDIQKRCIMFIYDKKQLNLPLTEEEIKLLPI